MTLLSYFSKASENQTLKGVLGKDIPSSTISSVNTEVQHILQSKEQQLAQKRGGNHALSLRMSKRYYKVGSRVWDSCNYLPFRKEIS